LTDGPSVCVIGLGRIGLPLAVQCASKGLHVTGCDIAPVIVEAVNAGVCPYPDEEGLADKLRDARAAGLLSATVDTTAAVRNAGVVVIVVPVALTPDNRADFSALDAAAGAVAAGLQPQTLVILETTVPLGTTRNRLGSILNSAPNNSGQTGVQGAEPPGGGAWGYPPDNENGPRAVAGGDVRRGHGADISLAFSPERVFVGRVLTDLHHYPKVVGGIDPESTRRAAAFYEKALDAPVLTVANCETAELVKLAETTYRDVNIALANEFARIAAEHGVDVTEAIAAANSQPFSHIHQPGVGVGGHCIPVYPRFLLENDAARLPEAARAINDGMAAYAVDRLARAIDDLQGKTVVILGLSYRPDIKEPAFSSAFLLAKELTARGARALVHDPHFTVGEIRALGLEPAKRVPTNADAVIVQAWHTAYRDLDFRAFHGCRALLDGRNALSRGQIESQGIRYLGIGRP
jgi:UDP-N-acetyl-D-mannosaminuronate dehydrogenase